MCASGNYKQNNIPKESEFIPSTRKPEQTQEDMLAELAKLR